MREVWPDTFVEEGNLTRNISLLRKVLSEAFHEPCIETIPKHGYRFLADVRLAGDIQEITAERHTITRFISEEESEYEESPEGKETEGSVARTKPVSLATTKARVTVLLASIVLIAAGAIGVRQLVRSRSREAGNTLASMSVSRFTASGNVLKAAISPDGKYVATVLDESGLQSLWVRQVSASTSGVRLVAAAAVDYWGVTFSNDSNFIYYVSWMRNESDASLYRLPVLGGTPVKLPTAVDTAVSFSPTGDRFAYVLSSSSRGESYVKITNVDGSGTQVLATRRSPDVIPAWPGGVAWSHDGRLVAYVSSGLGTSDGHGRDVFVADIDNKQERQLTSQQWNEIGRLAWLSDGSGLVISARAAVDAQPQLWLVSLLEGKARRITNDLHGYSGLTLSSDGKTIAAVQTQETYSIQVVPHSDQQDIGSNQASLNQILFEVGPSPEQISWTPDNRIVYSSRASGNWDIWFMNSAGSEKKQLTVDSHNDIFPSVSADGRNIYFASDRSGTFGIWRIGINGEDPRQLTNGANDVFPEVTSDAKWVIYQQAVGGVTHVRRVPAEGGESERLLPDRTSRPLISPDGQLLAFVYLDDREWGLAVRSLEGDESPRRFPFASTIASRFFRWTADGKALAYIVNEKGASNIWLQSLTGTPPRQMTNFSTGDLVAFAWSSDGKWSAYLRHASTSDVVLLRDFQ